MRARTESSPYAKAFFTLIDELGITGRTAGRAQRATEIRVVPAS